MSDFHRWSLKNELQLKICMCNWLSQSSKNYTWHNNCCYVEKRYRLISSLEVLNPFRKREKFDQVWKIKGKWYACRVNEWVFLLNRSLTRIIFNKRSLSMALYWDKLKFWPFLLVTNNLCWNSAAFYKLWNRQETRRYS